MSRVAAFGPCNGYGSQDSGSGFSDDPVPRASKDGTELGIGWRSGANQSRDIRNDVDNSTAITTLSNQIWYRFWIRMRRYPSFRTDTLGSACGKANLMQGISSCRGSIEGGVGAGLTMDSGGFLGWVNHGNLANNALNHLYFTPFPLALFSWYKVECFIKCVGPGSGTARLIVSDANLNVLADSGTISGGTASNGFNLSQNIYALLIGDAFGSVNHGMDYDMSHVVWDDGIGVTINTRLADSRVTRVWCVAPGTYQQFPTGNRSVEARGIINNSGGTEGVTNVGAAGQGTRMQTYRVKNLRSCGITGPIYHARVYLNQLSTGTPTNVSRVVLIVNGIIHSSPNGNTFGVQEVTFAFPGVTLTPDDTIEIGILTNITSGTCSMGGLCLLVDHDSPVTEIQTQDFEVGSVSWTGTGANTGQSIDLPFVPNIVFVHAKTTQPDEFTGSGAPGCFWWDTMMSFHYGGTQGPRRDQIRCVIDRQANTAQLQFAGNFPEFNTVGIAYYAVLIRDPTNRIAARGCVRQVDQGPLPYDTDNIFYTVGEGTSTPGQQTVFTPAALWLYQESQNTSLSPRLRGPAQVGDQSLPFVGGTPIADTIQQLTANGFQLGKTGAYQSNSNREPFIAFRKDAFVSQKLFDIVTWRGSQPSSLTSAESSFKRRIPVDLSGKAPEVIIAVSNSATPTSALWHAQLFGAQMQGFAETTVDGSQVLDGEPVATGMTLATNVASTGGKVIREFWYYLKKTGAPTGPMRVRIFPASAGAPTGTNFHASSEAIDASTLTASFQWVKFTFIGTNRFSMRRGTTYFASLEYVGTATDTVDVGQDQSAPVGTGTKYNRSSLDVWTIDSGADLAHRCFVGASMGWVQAVYDQAAIVDFGNDFFEVEETWNDGTQVGFYTFTSQDNAEALDGSPTATAQTFTCAADGMLAQAMFKLRRVGLPLGTFIYKLYATAAGVPTGAALATSDAMNVADVDNAFFLTYSLPFSGANQIALVNTTVYAIAVEYTGGVADYLEVGDDRSAPSAAGTKYNFVGGVWGSVAGQDLVFEVAVFGAADYTAFVFSIGLDALGLPPPGTWHEFLVAGHACKSIDSWYIGGVRQPTSSAEGDPDTEAYFLIPGFSAYENAFGTLVKTRTYNGRVYTCCYIKEGGNSPLPIQEIVEGKTLFTCNVQGIESVGDGSGTLIENAFDIYKHLMQNWVFGDYTAGGWLSTPLFPDTDAVPMMDDASFTACQAISVRRSGGYKGAGAIGADGSAISTRDLIRIMNQSTDADSGLNRKGQFFVAMTDDSAVVALFSPELTDVGDVLKATLDIEDDFSNHFNSIPYQFRKDYVSQQPSTENDTNPGPHSQWRSFGKLTDDPSVANYLDTLVMDALELFFVRDEVTAKDIVRRKLLRHKDPPRLVRWSVSAKGFNIELGDTRLITHFGGIGAGGWLRQPVRVQRHIAQLGKTKVDFEGYDMARLFEAVFILGDETVLQPTWTLAVGAFAGDRLYGYLCDEVTGLFSDGSPGKRLR